MRSAGPFKRIGPLVMMALAVAVVPALCPAASEPSLPRAGQITAHDVNIRAGAHLNYEILCKLDKNDLVLMTGQRGDWTRIAMPPGVLVWVSSTYVADDGLVEGESINVRGGPALKYNVLCQLERDDTVRIKARSKDGDWYGIVPPETAGAYIYAKYVADKGSPELYAKWAPRKDKCMTLLKSADALRTTELAKAEDKIGFDIILKNYRHIQTEYPDMPEARTVKRRIREVERTQQAVIERLAARHTAQEGPETQGTETKVETETQQDKPEPPKYLTTKGVLREISRESTKKGLYRITREDRWLCIVKSAKLDLGAYAGKAIQVWGLEAPSEGWSLRTINVSRIKLME